MKKTIGNYGTMADIRKGLEEHCSELEARMGDMIPAPPELIPSPEEIGLKEWRRRVKLACRQSGACTGEYVKLAAAETEYEVWTILFANKGWCMDKMIPVKYPAEFAFPEHYVGDIHIANRDLTGITFPKTVKGCFDVHGCDLNGVTLPEVVTQWFDLSDCDLRGLKLPGEIFGSISLSGCELDGVALPLKVYGSMDLRYVSADGLVLPSFGDYIDLGAVSVADKPEFMRLNGDVFTMEGVSAWER